MGGGSSMTCPCVDEILVIDGQSNIFCGDFDGIGVLTVFGEVNI
jgi:hypothetical protein